MFFQDVYFACLGARSAAGEAKWKTAIEAGPDGRTRPDTRRPLTAACVCLLCVMMVCSASPIGAASASSLDADAKSTYFY